MSIQGKINEVNSIKNELKSLRTRGSVLRTRIKQIEKEIEEYLDSKDQPGLKYKGIAIIRELKTKRRIKNKTDQQVDAINVLEKYGITNAKKVLEELMESKKGEPSEQRKLVFKKI